MHMHLHAHTHAGLDAASSLELLSHLHKVASSNRAVILTIHQPRLEIFHMFDKVILLCHGQASNIDMHDCLFYS